MRITPLGDSALAIELGEHVDENTYGRVQAAVRLLESPPLPGVTEVVPAFTTVTAFYDPLALSASADGVRVDLSELIHSMRSRLEQLPPQVEPGRRRTIEVPVCYGGQFGPDLAEVSAHTGLAAEEIIRIHTSAEHLVYVIGFSPGFPYLGRLPERLRMPRRSRPRTAVAPGSVGIVNQLSCIYPMATPGGWNLIGRTPLTLFRASEDPPSLLRPGDAVRFRAIDPDEFASLAASA